MTAQVPADPLPFPADGPLEPGETALLVIDMQADFCSPGGYMAALGCDLSGLRAPIEPLSAALAAARRAGLLVVYTRQGYRADLADQSPSRAARGRLQGSPIGRPGPLGRVLVRGEPGWQIIPELAPAAGDVIVDKTANGAFYGTDLDPVLRARGIRSLVLAGNTIDVCVHSSLREAVDRGFECLLLADGCGAASTDLHGAALAMVKVECGVFGCVADCATFVTALGR